MFVTKRLSDHELHELHKQFPAYSSWTFSEVVERFRHVATIIAPQNFSSQSVNEFLRRAEGIFRVKDINIPFHLSLDKTNSISLVCMLIVYKIVSYTYRYVKMTNPLISIPSGLLGSFYDCGIMGILKAYISKDDPLHSYSHLKQVESNNFFLYPQKLFRDEILTAENSKGLFIDSISSFYVKHGNNKAILPISHCVGELIMNFWSHATKDSETVVAARGNRNSFTLVLVDNGEGIISTLNSIMPNESAETILRRCVERKVSSRRCGDYHMGLGLFYVSELAKKNNGMLNIWSEGYHLSVNRSGAWTKKCGFWQGTIVELVLDVKQPKALADLDIYTGFTPTRLINFGADDETQNSH